MLKKILNKCWMVSTLVLTTLLTSLQANAADNPYQLMQQASDRLFASIKANQTQIKQNPNYMRTIVKQELMPYIHVNYAGSLVLGQYFRSTTPAQREQFFGAFANFIEQSYAQVLTMYSNQRIEIEREKKSCFDDVTKGNIYDVMISTARLVTSHWKHDILR